jgi:hypothetical protein
MFCRARPAVEIEPTTVGCECGRRAGDGADGRVGASLNLLNSLNMHDYISITLDPVDRGLTVHGGGVGHRRYPPVQAKLNNANNHYGPSQFDKNIGYRAWCIGASLNSLNS